MLTHCKGPTKPTNFEGPTKLIWVNGDPSPQWKCTAMAAARIHRKGIPGCSIEKHGNPLCVLFLFVFVVSCCYLFLCVFVFFEFSQNTLMRLANNQFSPTHLFNIYRSGLVGSPLLRYARRTSATKLRTKL